MISLIMRMFFKRRIDGYRILALVLTIFLFLIQPFFLSTFHIQAQSVTTIELDPNITYQTMTGWEAVSFAKQIDSDYDQFRDILIDAVVNDLGINRVRTEIRSGLENSQDYETLYRSGQIGYDLTDSSGNRLCPSDQTPYFRYVRYITYDDDADPVTWEPGDPFSVDAFITQNPNDPNPPGFQFAAIDDKWDRVIVPLKQAVEANGEKLHINMNYVAFTNQICEIYGPDPSTRDDTYQQIEITNNQLEEFAEYILATFHHLKVRYGFVPDTFEIVLEPDNVVYWSGDTIGRAMTALASRLEAHGYTPRFIAPSVTNMNSLPSYIGHLNGAPPYTQGMKGGIKAGRGFTDQQVDQFISNYITEYSYHRYGQNDNLLPNLTADAISHGIGTSMLEWWSSRNTYQVLHKDLKLGMNSAYQEAALAGLYIVYKNPYQVVIASKTKFTRQYYKFVRMGAQRISATTPTCGDNQICSGFDPLSFINTDGKYVVVVKAESGGDFSIQGLPVGTYGIKYTTTGEYDVDLSDQTVSTGQVLTINIPDAGVITIYAKDTPVSQTESYDLDFSTYLGGSSGDVMGDVVADNQGNIYITGWTQSSDFPTTSGAYDTTYNGSTEGYVMKYDGQGNLLWSTYLGGPFKDLTYSIDIDSQGYVYVAGLAGKNFPTTAGSFQPHWDGVTAGIYGEVNGIIVKLKPDGTDIAWASYFGTSMQIRDLDVGPSDDVYVIYGYNPSQYQKLYPDSWCNGCYQPSPAGDVDMYIARIKSDGSSVVWGTYLGGTKYDQADSSLAVDAAGNVYVAATTESTDIPTPNGYDQTYNGKGSGWGGDVYVAKLSHDGTNLLWGTYLGGTNSDSPFGKHGITVDDQGTVYVASEPMSDDFPTTAGAYDQVFNGQVDKGYGYDRDIAVSKFSTDGQLLASTFVGGDYGEGSEGISLDKDNNVYFGIGTFSDGSYPNDFPVTSGAYQANHTGDFDAAFFKLSSDLSELKYSSFMGTNSNDSFRAVATDANGNFYLAGTTKSPNWPKKNANQNTFGGGSEDSMLVKFSPSGATSTPTPFPTPIPGDANGDDIVDAIDYVIWLTQYLNYNPTANADPDFNQSGFVDGVDYVIWLNNYSPN